MLNPFEIIKRFIPPHKQTEIQDRIIDTLTNAFPNEQGKGGGGGIRTHGSVYLVFRGLRTSTDEQGRMRSLDRSRIAS